MNYRVSQCLGMNFIKIDEGHYDIKLGVDQKLRKQLLRNVLKTLLNQILAIQVSGYSEEW